MVGGDEDVTCVCTSLVTNTNELFEDKISFNQDISSWDTSKVLSMSEMFYNASNFNQDISEWNISSSIDLSSNITRFTMHQSRSYQQDK